jgi:carboxymethylenebutenolidase
MSEQDKNNIDPQVYTLYDDYAHNRLSRRSFVEKLATYAVGGLTVPALLSYLMPNYKDTAEVAPDDARLLSEYITYNSPKGGGEIRGLLSAPEGTKAKKLPGIVVVHENRGLNPYIEDVGRRAALEGFITLAPDALWPLGGYPGNDDDGRTLQRERDRNEMLEDFKAAYHYLREHPKCTGEVGVVGFCFGGWISNMMATQLPNLGAAVPFYGTQPTAEETAKINAPLLIHYAEEDERVNKGWDGYKAALNANNIDYQMHMYEGVKHGFHNNTTPRYDAKAAYLAWQRTIDFFKKNLK